MKTVTDLIDTINKLIGHPEIAFLQYQYEDRAFIGGNDIEPTHKDLMELYDEITMLACELLIDSKGGCNWLNINELKKTFDVTKGDSDSFGWLTGCIHTPEGIIVYG